MEDRNFEPKDLVRHFKGNIYKIVAIAEHTETGEKLVVYRNIKDTSKIWARPYDMFCGLVDKEKYPDAQQKYRFEKIEKDVK